MGLNVEHRQHKGLNNRAENSHLPTRRRKRIMKRFTSARHLKRLVSIHDPTANLQTVPATPRRHLAIERFVPRRSSCGAGSPNRASPRSARG
jgi:transposase-like protein